MKCKDILHDEHGVTGTELIRLTHFPLPVSQLHHAGQQCILNCDDALDEHLFVGGEVPPKDELVDEPEVYFLSVAALLEEGEELVGKGMHGWRDNGQDVQHLDAYFDQFVL